MRWLKVSCIYSHKPSFVTSNCFYHSALQAKEAEAKEAEKKQAELRIQRELEDLRFVHIKCAANADADGRQIPHDKAGEGSERIASSAGGAAQGIGPELPFSSGLTINTFSAR